MKLIHRVIFYTILVILSTSIGVIIATGSVFWKGLLTGIIIGMAFLSCFLGIWLNRLKFRSEWNSFLIRCLRCYLSIRNWTRRIMIRFSLWILCKLMDRRSKGVLPTSPSLSHRRDPDNRDEKILYCINQIGLS